jgi:hypothetical protein
MPDRPFWKEPPNLFSLFLIALLAVAYVLPFGDMDYGILIRLGELMVRTGDLRPPESFSYTIAGSDVPDFEWLFELIVWALWTAFGYGGLKLLKVVLAGSTMLLLALRLRREGVRWHGIALTLFVATLLLAASWNLRPLFITSIGLLLVSGWLHDHCLGRRQLPWALPVVMLLWANLHPGVITGQGLLVGAIAWEWLNRRVRLNTPLDRPACWRLTWIGGLGLAATFLSPAPVERLLCPFRPELRHPIQLVFVEMKPLWWTAVEPPYDGLAYFLLAAVFALTVVLRFRQYRLWEVGLLAGLFLLANLAIRSEQDWVLVTLALGVPHLAALLAQAARAGRRRFWVAWLLWLDCTCKRLLLSRALRFQWQWPAVVFGLLAVVSLIPPLSRRMPIQESSDYPSQAVSWIEANGLPTPGPWRIFSGLDNGAYLVWRLGDRVRCYADTRGFCYPPALLEDGYYIPQHGHHDPVWRARLDRVLAGDTDYLLLDTTGGNGNLWHALKPWVRPLYPDDGSAVLLTSEDVRQALRQLDRATSAQSRARK